VSINDDDDDDDDKWKVEHSRTQSTEQVMVTVPENELVK